MYHIKTMMNKKIGLCSTNSDLTRVLAEKFHATTGVKFIVFAEIASDYIAENIALINDAREKSNLERIILPTIEYMRKRYSDVEVVLLDMEVLMHDKAVRELKKDYTIIALKGAPPGTGIEYIMHKDYTARLEKIADVKAEKIEEVVNE